ncbi:retrovirus-related pol polyprotein from transposon TNT 1-94 [Tanacetum coccineum]
MWYQSLGALDLGSQVEFHREIHDLNFRGSSCKNLFVLSSSNRGRLLGFTDLMRQKNKRMKQEGLIQHYGILEDLKSNSIEFHRRNRTLIEAARTMLADAKLPVTFWAEAVNTACYVQNRVQRFDAKGDEVVGQELLLLTFQLFHMVYEAQMITTNDAAKKSGGILIDSPQKEQEEVHTDKDVSEQVEHEVNE